MIGGSFYGLRNLWLSSQIQKSLSVGQHNLSLSIERDFYFLRVCFLLLMIRSAFPEQALPQIGYHSIVPFVQTITTHDNDRH